LHNTEGKQKIMDSMSVESFITLNESAAKQWEALAEVTQNMEIKRLLSSTVVMERKFASDLKGLLSKISN